MGKASASVSASSSGKYVNATITWDSGPEVTVNVSSNGSWRLVKRGNSSDVKLSHSYATDSYSDTFDASDGGEYIFQVYCPVEESYYNNSFSTSGFTVNFGESDDDDEGGSSGGSSGGGSSGPYYIHISKGTGVQYVEVLINWSQFIPDSWNKFDGDPIWKDDTYHFNAAAQPGYTIDYYTVGGQQIPCQLTNFTFYNVINGKYIYSVASNADAYVYATATPNAYTLSIAEGVGSNITVIREDSNHPNAGRDKLYNGSTIYHDDVLLINFEADEGYEITTHTVNGTSIENGGRFTVSGATTISLIATPKSYDLELVSDLGATIAVNRTSSPLKKATTGLLASVTNGEEKKYADKIYYGDVLKIDFTYSEAYQSISQLVNEEYFVSGNTLTVDGNVRAVATTGLSGIVHIFNDSTFENYIIYIYDGSTWAQCIPYIYDEAKWFICS